MKSLKKFAVIAARGVSSTYALQLGQAKLNEFSNLSSCTDRSERIDSFRMRVNSGSASIKNITLVFGNNKTKQIDFYDQFMSAGDVERIQLERRRCIKSVIITGQATDRNFNVMFRTLPRNNVIVTPDYVDNIIRPGDEVVETNGTWSVQTVNYITEDGKYMLSNGSLYHENQVQKLLPSHNGFSVNEEVLETNGTWSLQRVTRLTASGKFLLANGSWYDQSQIVKLVNQHRGVSLNQEVLETNGTWSVQRVTKISQTGKFLLGNGSWYDQSQIVRLVSSYEGIRIGDTVLETNGTHSTQRVVKISENGKFLLGNGSWYDRSQVQRIYQ
jgi:hypothetical protein